VRAAPLKFEETNCNSEWLFVSASVFRGELAQPTEAVTRFVPVKCWSTGSVAVSHGLIEAWTATRRTPIPRADLRGDEPRLIEAMPMRVRQTPHPKVFRGEKRGILQYRWFAGFRVLGILVHTP
jgi:hypothetical protein